MSWSWLSVGPHWKLSALGTTAGDASVLATANIAVQFGAKPLFRGRLRQSSPTANRYGSDRRHNGCGSRALMKVLQGRLEPSVGEVIFAARGCASAKLEPEPVRL